MEKPQAYGNPRQSPKPVAREFRVHLRNIGKPDSHTMQKPTRKQGRYAQHGVHRQLSAFRAVRQTVRADIGFRESNVILCPPMLSISPSLTRGLLHLVARGV